jgi:glycerol-3-phosphate dehydrogenase (NAD(P)+)
MKRNREKIAVIGGGSWGTALALLAAGHGYDVRLWVLEKDLVETIREKRENVVFLPGYSLPENIAVSGDLSEVLGGTRVVLLVVPAQHCREVLERMVPLVEPEMIFVSATKGLEVSTRKTISEVIREVVSKRFPPGVCVLSGPSFAREVAAGQPTAVTVASSELSRAEYVQRLLSSPVFRIYASDDVVGLEIGGALKNVIALAAGVLHGLGYGHNTMAALITRGLAEVERLGIAMGGKPETLAGLSGMGDLVLTCTGAMSRNRALGVEIGSGKSLAEALAGKKTVAEGVETTRCVVALAGEYYVEMPIAEKVHQILFDGKNPEDAVMELMGRSLKPEREGRQKKA